MSIWVDVDGWPVPPIVLLGCLAAEILYFRGWFALIKEERASETTTTRKALTSNESEFRVIAWDSWLFRGVYFFSAILLAIVGDSVIVDYRHDDLALDR